MVLQNLGSRKLFIRLRKGFRRVSKSHHSLFQSRNLAFFPHGLEVSDLVLIAEGLGQKVA